MLSCTGLYRYNLPPDCGQLANISYFRGFREGCEEDGLRSRVPKVTEILLCHYQRLRAVLKLVILCQDATNMFALQGATSLCAQLDKEAQLL